MSGFGDKLRDVTSGCRFEVKLLGTTRSMTPVQKRRLAETFGADESSVRGGRAVLQRAHPLVSPIFRLIGSARDMWKTYTVPYEDGVRLIRTDRVEWMRKNATDIQFKIESAVGELRDGWSIVVEDARARLGDLFVESDYTHCPTNIGIDISFPAIQPDPRLAQLAPEVFEAERRKVAAKFEEAAALSEQMLAEEFAKLIDHLRDKLTPDADGKKKVLQERSVDAIVEFASRFKELSIGSNAQLDAVVEQARALSNNIDIKSLRSDETLRDRIAKSLTEIGDAVQVIVAPSRQFEL